MIVHEGERTHRVGLQMDPEVVSRKDREEQLHRVDWDRKDDRKDWHPYHTGYIRHCSVCVELHQPVWTRVSIVTSFTTRFLTDLWKTRHGSVCTLSGHLMVVNINVGLRKLE